MYMINFDEKNSFDCPLCKFESTNLYHKDKKRLYYQCSNCFLVFVPKQFHVSKDDEKREYDLHENSPDDLGYRKFLSRIAIPIINRVNPSSEGLDFGCGPGPTLSLMLEEQGLNVKLFDLYYYFDESVFNKKYDFITATEVFEHLRDPAFEIERLFASLKNSGLLGIMTKLVLNKEAFSKWHYTHDQTHITFFSKETFIYISKLYNCNIDFVGTDVILLQKS